MIAGFSATRSSWGTGTARATGALVMREIATSYGRASGGYLWAVAEPVLGIVLLTLVFSLGFDRPPLGHSFALFYATGLVPFLHFFDVSGKTSQALNFSRQLLSYPNVSIADALAARMILNTATQMVAATLIFCVLTVLMGAPTTLDLGHLALAYAMVSALALGAGVMNCALMLAWPAWQQVWSILSRPLFLISCLFYLPRDIPEPYVAWLWWNPLVHVTGAMRQAFYPFHDTLHLAPGYVFGVAFVMAAIGVAWLVFRGRDALYA